MMPAGALASGVIVTCGLWHRKSWAWVASTAAFGSLFILSIVIFGLTVLAGGYSLLLSAVLLIPLTVLSVAVLDLLRTRKWYFA